MYFRPNGGQDQEGTALPYVARTKKQPVQKTNQTDGLGSSRCNSSNSIFNQDPGSASSSQRKNINESTVRTGGEDEKGVYGMDNEFLKKICSWRPKAYGSPRTEGHNTSDKSDSSVSRNDNFHDDVSQINCDGKLPFSRRLNSTNLPISESGIPSFEQFRKATGALWERAQDFLPSAKLEEIGENRNRKENRNGNGKENGNGNGNGNGNDDEVMNKEIENKNGEENNRVEDGEENRNHEGDLRNNDKHNFEFFDMNDDEKYNKNNKNSKNSKNGKNSKNSKNVTNGIVDENRKNQNKIEFIKELHLGKNQSDNNFNYYNNTNNYIEKDLIIIENSDSVSVENSFEKILVETKISENLISPRKLISKNKIDEIRHSSPSNIKSINEIECKNGYDNSVSTVNGYHNKYNHENKNEIENENENNDVTNGINSEYDRMGRHRKNGQRSRGLSNPIFPIHGVLTNSMQHVPFDNRYIEKKGDKNVHEDNINSKNSYFNNENNIPRERPRPMIVSSDDCIVNINNLSLNYNNKMF